MRAGWFRLGTSLINLRLPDEAAVAFQTAAVLEPQCAAPLQHVPVVSCCLRVVFPALAVGVWAGCVGTAWRRAAARVLQKRLCQC